VVCSAAGEAPAAGPTSAEMAATAACGNARVRADTGVEVFTDAGPEWRDGTGACATQQDAVAQPSMACVIAVS